LVGVSGTDFHQEYTFPALLSSSTALTKFASDKKIQMLHLVAYIHRVATINGRRLNVLIISTQAASNSEGIISFLIL
jgi:hypothetical protein